jgi:hypothetical protein
MQAKGPDLVTMRAVGGGLGVSRPSVALRDEHLDYALLSLADLVIRVPMGGGTHVGKVRCASTSKVARTLGRCGVPWHPKTRARRERARCLYIGRNTHVGVRARVGDGGNADHQIRLPPMARTSEDEPQSFDLDSGPWFHGSANRQIWLLLMLMETALSSGSADASHWGWTLSQGEQSEAGRGSAGRPWRSVTNTWTTRSCRWRIW